MPSRPPPPDLRPVEIGRPHGEAIHATAVAIAGIALLILGPSRSGKSWLAAALVAASSRRRPITLIGDDRILLTPTSAGLVARPHPRIAGFIERRGLGLVACRFCAAAPVGGVVSLERPPEGSDGSTTSRRALTQNFPTLAYVESARPDAQSVLLWWPRRFYNTGAEIAVGPLGRD